MTNTLQNAVDPDDSSDRSAVRERSDLFAAPALPVLLLARPAIVSQLALISRRKLCTVIAPAGYGKTVSVALFVAAAKAEYYFRWLVLQPTDLTFAVFLPRFVQAITSAYPLFEPASRVRLETAKVFAKPAAGTQTSSEDVLSPEQTERLGFEAGEVLGDVLTDELIFVIDDYHLIGESRTVKAFMTGLIAGSPPHFRLILTSRTSVNLDVMRLAARQQLLEITADQLAFSATEIQKLVAAESSLIVPTAPMAPAASAKFAASLYEMTGGWAASVVLALISGHEASHQTPAADDEIANRATDPITDTTSHLTQTGTAAPYNLMRSKPTIYKYLSEQLYEQQTDDVKKFLCATAPAPQFDKHLAEKLFAVFTPDVAASQPQKSTAVIIEPIIGRLVAAKLLLTPAGSSSEAALREEAATYQYHHLLRDFLLTKLTEATLQKLYTVCGEYAEAATPFEAAAFFIMAGEGERALVALVRLSDSGEAENFGSLQHRLGDVARLPLSPRSRIKLICVQARTEQRLGNVSLSEAMILPHRSASVEATGLPDDAIYEAESIHLENLLLQSRFVELRTESRRLLDVLTAIENTSLPVSAAVRVRAMTLYGYALSVLAPASGEKEKWLGEAMTHLELAWQLAQKMESREAECEVLRLRYFVATQVGYAEALAAFKDREPLLPYISLKSRIDAMRDHAFLLVAAGALPEAKPHVLECLRLSEQAFYHSSTYTAKFLLGTCFVAEGKFDDALECYDEAALYYAGVSRDVLITVLWMKTICCFYIGDAAAAERHASECRAIHTSITPPLPLLTVQMHEALYFAALADKEFGSASLALETALQTVDASSGDTNSTRVELYLFAAYLDVVRTEASRTPSIKAFIVSVTAYLKAIDTATVDLRHQSIFYYWRLAETVLQKLLDLITAPTATLNESERRLLRGINLPQVQSLLAVVVNFKRQLGVLPVAPSVINSGGKLESSLAAGHQQGVAVKVRIITFGGLQVFLGDAATPTLTDTVFQREAESIAFKLLLLNHRRPVTAETFYEAIWPFSKSANRENMLRVTLSNVRRRFIDTRIVSPEQKFILKTEQGYALDFGLHGTQYFCDLEEFNFCMEQAAVARLPRNEAAALYRKAAALYQGEFLQHDHVEEWLAHIQERMKDKYMNALLFIAETALIEKNNHETIERCTKLLELDSVSERGHELLIIAYLNLNLQSEALQAFRTCRKSFRRELGTFPPTRIERLIKI